MFNKKIIENAGKYTFDFKKMVAPQTSEPSFFNANTSDNYAFINVLWSHFLESETFVQIIKN